MRQHSEAAEAALVQVVSGYQDEINFLRGRLKEANALIEKIKLKVIEPTDPNWADAASARKSRFDIADWCSAFTHREADAK
jgi:hypothetical protein